MPSELATLPQIQPSPVVVRPRHSVLIIDDDDTLLEVLSHRLKQQGFATHAAYSGSTGLTKAKAELPSAIILDLGLPDTDGLTVCEQLTDSPETCSVPILILSGKEEPGLVRQCRRRLPLFPAKALRSQRPARAGSRSDPRGERQRGR